MAKSRKLSWDRCPQWRKHTACPTSYMAWYAWAEKKMKTHRQVKCIVCGLWAIWVPRLKVTRRG